MQTASEIYLAIRSVEPQFKRRKAKPKSSKASAQVTDFKKQLKSLTPEQLEQVLALIATE